MDHHPTPLIARRIAIDKQCLQKKFDIHALTPSRIRDPPPCPQTIDNFSVRHWEKGNKKDPCPSINIIYLFYTILGLSGACQSGIIHNGNILLVMYKQTIVHTKMKTDTFWTCIEILTNFTILTSGLIKITTISTGEFLRNAKLFEPQLKDFTD